MQQKSSIRYTSIDLIVVGDRLRKDLGDLTPLADSIRQRGIVVPIAVTPDMELIYGQRRLEAARLAGIELIPHVVIETQDDDDWYREIEMLENTERKDFTIEEKIRIVDLAEQKVNSIKDRIRAARISGDQQAAEAAHRELESLLQRSIDRVPGKRVILKELVGLGERNMQWAREVVHAYDQQKTPVLAEIVKEMNRTGAVRPAFDKYLKTLPPAAFVKSTRPAAVPEPEEVDTSYLDEEPAERGAEESSVGNAIRDVIGDSDRHTEELRNNKKNSKPAPRPAGGNKPSLPASGRAKKQKGQTRTHRVVVFDEESLRQQREAFIKKTMRGIDPQHQERAIQILAGGSTAELAASVQQQQEVTDSGTAMRRVEQMHEDLPPDQQEAFVDSLRKWLKKKTVLPDADIPEHLNTPEFLEAWSSWWADRKRRKLSVSDLTKRKELKLLANGDAEQATEIVLKAEESQWKGIPNNIWIPSRDGFWCGRLPPHADKDLLKKIKATDSNGASYRSFEDQKRDRANKRSVFVDDEG